MSNCVFGFPDYTQATTLYTPTASGGSFSASLPVSNVLDRRLSKVARSSDATTASNTIVFDLGAARSVGLLATRIPNITKSSTPTIRWKANSANSFGAPAYDSGALQFWPTGVTAEDAENLNVWHVHLPTSAQNYRYWQAVVSDTANVDGYLDWARVFIAGAYTPSINLSTGAQSPLEDDSVRTLTDGGAALYYTKSKRRSDRFTVENTPDSETFGTVRKMQRRLGTTKQLFFVFDASDTYMYERAYLCVMRELGAIEYPYSADFRRAAYSLVEEL